MLARFFGITLLLGAVILMLTTVSYLLPFRSISNFTTYYLFHNPLYRFLWSQKGWIRTILEFSRLHQMVQYSVLTVTTLLSTLSSLPERSLRSWLDAIWSHRACHLQLISRQHSACKNTLPLRIAMSHQRSAKVSYLRGIVLPFGASFLFNASTLAMGVLSVTIFFNHLWRGENAVDQCCEETLARAIFVIFII